MQTALGSQKGDKVTNLPLYIATAAIPIIAALGYLEHLFRQRRNAHLTITEWRERLRKLDRTHLVTPPKYLSKSVSIGAVGVCRPEPKEKPGKIAVVKRKAVK